MPKKSVESFFYRINAALSIWHTCWATHGVSSGISVHPYFNGDVTTIFLVRGGA
jgi:glucosamine 6-phosphate synthetase-like amidotransferase/phosphosugar isomerase protein